MPVPAAEDLANAAAAELASLIPEEGLPVAKPASESGATQPVKLTPIEETVAAKPVPAKADTTPAPTGEPTRNPDGTFAPKASDAEPVVPNPEAAPEVAPEPDEADEEWTFNAWNQPIAIPGARIKPGVGVFIPESSLADTRRLIARGTQYDRVMDERNRFKDSVTREQIRAQAVLEVSEPLMSVEGLVEAGMPRDRAEILFLRMEAASERKARELSEKFAGQIVDTADLTAGSTADQDQDRQEAVERALVQTLASPELVKVLKAAPSARKHLTDRAHRFQGQFFVGAPYDGPGFKKGQTVFDAHGFRAFLTEEAQLFARAHPVAPKSPPASGTPSSSAKPQAVITAPPTGAGKIAPTASAPPKKPSDDRRSPSKTKPWREQLDSAFNDITASL